MPNFSYEGLDKNGKRTAGQVVASDMREARKLLRGQGIRPRKINPPSILEFDISEWMVEKGFAKPFGSKELGNFTKQLSIMVNAGVPILQALEILFKSEKHPVMKKTIKSIASDVGEGKTIAESLEKQNGFNKLYCSLVKAGETGGILDSILGKLVEHIEKQEKIKTQVKSALTYPVIVSTIGCIVVWGLMVFVVPQFVGMLTDTGQEMPWITQFVIDTSEFFGNNSMLMIGVFILLSIGFSVVRSLDQGKEVIDKFSMQLPIFGMIIIKSNLATFARTLSTMMSSGVSLIDALEISIETLDNKGMVADITEVRKEIIQGKTMTETLGKIDYFPEMTGQMIKVGETTGSLDSMLLKVADLFEDEVSELIESGTKLIEPLILVVLGVIIAGILVAMYLPMFMSAGG